MIVAAWCLFLFFGWMLYLVISEDGKGLERVSQDDLAQLHLERTRQDQQKLHTWRDERWEDQKKWRRAWLDARELDRNRKFRIFWDGEVNP